MANTIVNLEKFAARSQMNFESTNSALRIASYQFQGDLRFGERIDLPYGSGIRLSDYTFGSDITKKDISFTSDELIINNKKAFRFEVDTVQDKQAHDPQWWDDMADSHGMELARNGAQLVAQTGVDAADKTVTLGDLSVGQVGEAMTLTQSVLFRQRVPGGRPFILAEPEFAGLLQQHDAANGFNRADRVLNAGLIGQSYGFQVIECEDLPCSQTITLAANPTNGDTLPVGPVTITFATTASAAGQCDIGADAAATQANLRAMINGTGTGDGTDYFEFSVEDRDLLTNAQVSCGAFAANVATVTSYGRLGMGDASFTSGSNVAGAETCDMLAGYMGAIDYVVQTEPTVNAVQVPGGPRLSVFGVQVSGAKVFERHSRKLVKLPYTLSTLTLS
jgi:hypothetical protein